ncbi:hypothetical protein GLOIN_2v79276 [Rhizophagus irregularis DAOM 181602=DAOM 197198]|uniref:Uncharacterized protein n=1 Tax=Rhizophagus irregularis (strain DAOM 181602 / DAOM 197198 / MUCL 43194) TaxID=747089 RepID=A0A2P4Q0L9_RHIID|nr:hypothetical protein GLOIN_2v79276 [Rhizophagus irregularis DAOM 181602=DAOM 197198]POG71183.1 hypothetical protein GLOIN_2v79276 [Rhizophagus irregularis DAOM 181602=DAOM 197198]|eukprot:XP_025178049.1 hypothetical protein GLOIN_2v79276 [Rhizophagus irregularis DAOM 181602=DAOM 197198]
MTEDNNKIVLQEFEYLMRENRAMVHEYVQIVFEAWNSYKQLRGGCEKKIEDCQEKLLRWIQRIIERLQDYKNLELQEKKEKLERLERRVCELKTVVEKKINDSLIGSFYISDCISRYLYYISWFTCQNIGLKIVFTFSYSIFNHRALRLY